MRRRGSWRRWLAIAVFALAGLGATDALAADQAGPLLSSATGLAELQLPFKLNTLRTTIFGPSYADVVVKPSNFLPCRGGPYALCYYSGPDPLPCEPGPGGMVANCQCVEIPYGAYFVDINAILNLWVYLQTVSVCGHDGANCQNRPNAAPVCQYINDNTLIPGADLVSTFSFDCAPEEGLGKTSCGTAVYAGCMTAPCKRTGVPGEVECACPTVEGPFQVGQNGASCDLGPDLVWSAAYAPLAKGKTFPTSPSGRCFPDAPGPDGCPLLSNPIPPPGPAIDCKKVCDQYEACQKPGGVEIGFTCDATLCTSSCTDNDLVSTACSGLQRCDISEIVKLEVFAGCSCCASQICHCQPSQATSEQIFSLDQAQRARGIVPQCDINGTLCGTDPGAPLAARSGAE